MRANFVAQTLAPYWVIRGATTVAAVIVFALAAAFSHAGAARATDSPVDAAAQVQVLVVPGVVPW